MNEDIALTIRGLSKSYGKVRALRGVDLEARRGEIFGFLGPNGAGKTTTIRCLLDLIRPNAGMARVLGIDPQADPVAVQTRTGYLPGELHLDDNMTAEHQIGFFNAMRGGKADWADIRRLADRLDLDLKRPIKNLSKGNKQKVGVVQALMHRPEMLLLDEPTSGLDPLMQQEVYHLLGEAKVEGATIFFSSHVISEVEAIADRVGIIRNGKIVEIAEPSQLVSMEMRRIRVRFKEEVDVGDLAQVDGVTLLHGNGLTATLQVAGEMDGLIKALGTFPVSDMDIERPSLEEIFLAFYRES